MRAWMPSRAVDWRYSSRFALRVKKRGVGIGTGMWGEDVRVAFLVDRVWVCDGEEARVDVEGGVFFDGDGLAG